MQQIRYFPGGPVVKNPSCNAGDAGSIPGRGTKIPHAAGQISPRDTTREKPCTAVNSPHAASKTRRSRNINK